ncbi:MAG: acyl-homoserine-lactone synthase [Alphaproteobacteria bacterium]
MIKVVNHRSLDRNGHLLVGQFKLRYKEFIQRQDYEVKTFDGMEYDQYDTPAATYLVYEEEDGSVQGVSRLTPVMNGCMLKDLWPHLVENKEQFEDQEIWEGTRFCINKDLPPDQRRRICYEISLAYVEYGMQEGIKKIIGMMPTFILKSVFERSGITLERLGPVFDMAGFSKVQAAGIPVNLDQIKNVRRKTGLFSVLNDFESLGAIKAA